MSKFVLRTILTASLLLSSLNGVALADSFQKEYAVNTPISQSAAAASSSTQDSVIDTSRDTNKYDTISYTEFLSLIKDQKISEAYINLSNDTFACKTKEGKIYITDNPKTQNFKEFLLLNNVKVKELKGTTSYVPQANAQHYATRMESIIFWSIPSVILLCVLIYRIRLRFSKQLQTGNTTIKEEKKETKIPNTTFHDIQGCAELKKDIQFIIEFLKNPDKYKSMGVRMPKGIVLYGPPGTGKTLTAKAVAGTAGVPFINISGSDFVHMYVGVGAKKVRDLYKEARSKAPCIVFIDEIDAVGGKRGRDENTEREQTINALLTELDGFGTSDSVITICATNRIDMLDEALIRPGRFDKHLAVPLPEREDRLAILQLHAANKKFAEGIDLNDLAKMTVGFSGAALESLLNEAAFIAVNKNKPFIDKEDLDRAFYKQVMQGDEKEDVSNRDLEELKLVAYHEAGHALATKLLTDDEVSKVTIIPSTSGAGGVTFRTPKKMGLHSKRYLRNLIQVMYAGRVGEYLCLGNDEDITTGASKDIEQASQYIKEYISSYGMSEEYGMINLKVFSNYDDSKLIEQASLLAKELYKEIEVLLFKNKTTLINIAESLIENETLTSTDLDKIIQNSTTLSA